MLRYFEGASPKKEHAASLQRLIEAQTPDVETVDVHVKSFDSATLSGISATYDLNAEVDTTMINDSAFTVMAVAKVVDGTMKKKAFKAAGPFKTDPVKNPLSLKSTFDAELKSEIDMWDHELSKTPGSFVGVFSAVDPKTHKKSFYLGVKSAVPAGVVNDIRNRVRADKMTWGQFCKSPLPSLGRKLAERNARRLLKSAADFYGCEVLSVEDVMTPELEKTNGAVPLVAETVVLQHSSSITDKGVLSYDAIPNVRNNRNLLVTEGRDLHILPMKTVDPAKHTSISVQHHKTPYDRTNNRISDYFHDGWDHNMAVKTTLIRIV